MSKAIYRLTFQIAVILSTILAINLIFDGYWVRAIMHLILLGCFLITSKLFQKKYQFVSISYLFVFFILYFVNSLISAYCTEEVLLELNKIKIFGWWTEDYFTIYFWSIFFCYIFICFYMKFICKCNKINYSDINNLKSESFNMTIGCILLVTLYFLTGKSFDIILPMIVFFISKVIIINKNKAFNIIVSILIIILFIDYFIGRYKFIQIAFPIIFILIIMDSKRNKEYKLHSIYIGGIITIIVLGLYGTISELYKLNTVWGGNYNYLEVLFSAELLKKFFYKQFYRLFGIWIKLGGYIIGHVQKYGFYYGLTYIKIFSSILGFEYVSLPKISAIYDKASYAQPGLLAEGYANFGILGAILNICAVFFLMEYIQRRFYKKPTYSGLLLMTVPFTKILFDGGTLNSALVIIFACYVMNISNILNLNKSKR